MYRTQIKANKKKIAEMLSGASYNKAEYLQLLNNARNLEVLRQAEQDKVDGNAAKILGLIFIVVPICIWGAPAIFPAVAVGLMTIGISEC